MQGKVKIEEANGNVFIRILVRNAIHSESVELIAIQMFSVRPQLQPFLNIAAFVYPVLDETLNIVDPFYRDHVITLNESTPVLALDILQYQTDACIGVLFMYILG